LAVLDDIAKWASELPAWQSDAVRRLLVQEEGLSRIDEEALLFMLKGAYGLLEDGETAPEAIPLNATVIPGTCQSSQNLTLEAIKDLKNVGQILPGGPPLTFGAKGLTIIYGDNGSGKSGYARVLKKACRSRDAGVHIYPNVYADMPSGPASASFVVILPDGQKKEAQWVDGNPLPEILTSIWVFDSRCARVIIDQDNDVAYLPYGASVFHELTTLCEKFKQILKKERPELTKPLIDGIPISTKAHKFLANLNVDTDSEAINEATVWATDNEKEMQRLAQDMARVTAEDTKQQAARLRNLKNRVFDLKEKLSKIAVTLSDKAVVDLTNKIREVKAAQRVFEIASLQGKVSEPLAGVGVSEWRALYEAARDYSISIAYKEHDFPFTGLESRCILCMQELSDEAKQRFQRFKAFMENTTKKKLDLAKDDLINSLKVLSDLDFDILDTHKDALDEIGVRKEQCANSVKTYIEQGLARKMAMQSAGQNLGKLVLTELPDCRIEDIDILLTSMETDVVKLESIADPEKLASLRNSLAELSAQKSLHQKKTELIKYVHDLKLAALYDLCIKETDTGGISKKGREIISASLTHEFETLLNKHLSDFGASLQFSLEPRGVKGEMIHKLKLCGCQLPAGAKVTDILSEGEQSIVSIGSFLAELEACGHNNPIVFDDPVCSLDHNWRGKVAERLVFEAKTRQVIVFTHDIFFTNNVMDISAATGTTLAIRCILRHGDTPGIADEGVPWKVGNVNQRLDTLEKKVAQLRKTRSDLTTEQYADAARPVYSKMRTIWEDAIEQVAFQGIVRRYRNQIQVNPIILKVTTLDIVDCRILLTAHKKCCDLTEAHSALAATNAPVPEPCEMTQDLCVLKEWVCNLKGKQNALSQ